MAPWQPRGGWLPAVAAAVVAVGIACTLPLRAAAELVQVQAAGAEAVDAALPPLLPLNFHANVTVIAHLVDRAAGFPPWKRVVEVWYDYAGTGRGAARAVVHAGLDAPKTFLRRWDSRHEYATRNDAYAECRRGFLSEPMPLPSLPALRAVPVPGVHRIHPRRYAGFGGVIDSGAGGPLAGGDGQGLRRVRAWVVPDDVTGRLERTKLYFDADTNLPLRVVTESAAEDGTWQPVMTWTWENLTVNSTTAADFGLPPPWRHESCDRVVGGWPYLHLFSHYLRV